MLPVSTGAAGALVAASLLVPAPPASAHFVPAPCDFITGGGFVFRDDGERASFGSHGGCKNGGFWGHVNYVDHGGFAGVTPYHVSSVEITGYLIDPAFPNARDICGFARTNAGEQLRFRVRMEDNGEPGRDDRFGIRLENGYLVTARSLGGRRQRPAPQAQPLDHRAAAAAQRVRDVRGPVHAGLLAPARGGIRRQDPPGPWRTMVVREAGSGMAPRVDHGSWTIERFVAPPALALALAAAAGAQSYWPPMSRVEGERATVHVEEGVLSEEEIRAFAGLVERGIRDIESTLGLSGGANRRIYFFVGRRVRISMSRGRRIFLPVARVQERRAPYLHETVHALVPGGNDALWLAEGFASYVESQVSETLGGYDAHLFSADGNRGIDRHAARVLRTAEGQAVLPFVGGEGRPPGLYRDRSGVAAPFYVLSHSFLKFLVDRLGVRTVRGFLEAEDVAAAVETRTGRTIAALRSDWLSRLQAPGS
jgi:hypothetical protein